MCEISESETYECHAVNCTMKFETMHEMVIHINQEHGEGHLQKDSTTLLESSSKFIGKKLVYKESCDYCGRLFTKQNKHVHMLRCSHAAEKTFICKIKMCQSSFALQIDLDRHVNKVHRALVKCKFKNCDAFLKPSSLDAHMKSVHEKIKETCLSCGKQVTYKNLKEHINRCISNGEKKFPCPYEDCKASFTTTGNRSAHINRSHKNTAPRKCPREDCDAMILRRSLFRHIKEVHEKSTKMCPSCNGEFAASNIQRHQKRCLNRRGFHVKNETVPCAL